MKGTVPTTTFSGPSAAYKLNCSYYCFRRCFSPYTARINLAATARINLAATARINLAATPRINLAVTARINLAAASYSPPYRQAARSWPYYYRPLYYGAARYRSYRRCLQLLRGPILD